MLYVTSGFEFIHEIHEIWRQYLHWERKKSFYIVVWSCLDFERV